MSNILDHLRVTKGKKPIHTQKKTHLELIVVDYKLSGQVKKALIKQSAQKQNISEMRGFNYLNTFVSTDWPRKETLENATFDML